MALERAMHVFWAKGYEGAALSDLTRAMRINRPSLYAAFGNKEQLFRKVLDRYMNGPLAFFGKALGAAKARDVIEQIFLGAANMPSDPRTPVGCLVVQGALACGDAAGSVRKEIAARRAAAKVALRRRLQRAKREGDLPSNADPAELSSYVMTVLHGMAVQGADGANQDQHVASRKWHCAGRRPSADRYSTSSGDLRRQMILSSPGEVTVTDWREVVLMGRCRGWLFCGMLARAGAPVVMVGQNQSMNVRRTGGNPSGCDQERVSVEATTESVRLPVPSHIVCVKSNDTVSAAKDIALRGSRCRCCFFKTVWTTSRDSRRDENRYLPAVFIRGCGPGADGSTCRAGI
jgi:AcrR family transcriptional regulator